MLIISKNLAGALHLMGGGLTPQTPAHSLALGAAFVSSINIGGGFTVRSIHCYQTPKNTNLKILTDNQTNARHVQGIYLRCNKIKESPYRKQEAEKCIPLS